MLSVDIPAIFVISLPPDSTASEQRAFLAKIASIVGKYRHCVEELEELQREAEASLAAVTYPVLTLPPEITSGIFSACLPTDSEGFLCPAPHTAPLLLAQICRHWREVALSMCELWSSMDPVDPYRCIASALVESWFTRAKLHSLSLRLDVPHLVFIPSISDRLRRMFLTTTDLEDLKPFPPFPELQHLQLIRCKERGEETNEADVTALLKNTPRLHKLALDAFPVGSIPFIASLTSLEIDQPITLKMFSRTLTHLPLLAHLCCALTGDTKGATGPPITRPHLRSLLLMSNNFTRPYLRSLLLMSNNFDNSPHNTLALTFLTLPTLNRLEIAGKLDLEVILALAARSSCRLHHLGVDLSSSTTEENARCLQAFPFLTALHVTLGEQKDINDNFLISLTSTTPSLIPHLQTMTIFTPARMSCFYPEQNIEYALLIQMLRRRQVAGLRSFKLNLGDRTSLEYNRDDWDPRGWSRPGPLQSNQLQGIIEAGCDVQINFMGGGPAAAWPEEDPED
ncbi:hypothetical protein C8R46DRAFT_996835 [Mycena filopes]|nr:hypothetical protein C8R46DRAFT_996835 [Mycena filopes]